MGPYVRSFDKITKLHKKYGNQIPQEKLTKMDLLVYLQRCAQGDEVAGMNMSGRVLEDITSAIQRSFTMRDELRKLHEKNERLHGTIEILLDRLAKK